MRAFLAIELPDEVRRGLFRMEDSLRGTLHVSASWVREENIHLTLRFLGDASEAEIECITETLIDKCPTRQPFEVSVGGFGVFPSFGKARVLWCSVEDASGCLLAVQTDCENAAVQAGLPPELKAWTPHVTVARFRESPPEPRLREALSALDGSSAGEFPVESVTLFSSTLTPRGAIHTPLRKFRFACPTKSSNEPSTTS